MGHHIFCLLKDFGKGFSSIFFVAKFLNPPVYIPRTDVTGTLDAIVLLHIFRFEALSPPQSFPNIAPLYPNFALNLLGFCLFACAPQTPFSCVGLVACRLPSLMLRCALLDATFRNLFSLFLVGSKSNVSAVFRLRFRMVWALYFFLFSGFQKRRFAFSWLRFRNGFGTKPAGVLPFRMCVPNTFFLSLAW